VPSEAARARALARGPGLVGFLLAHHWPGQLDRCYRFRLGAKPVWVCARCLGVYPVMVALVVALLALRPPLGWWDWPWLYGLPLPALVDWAYSRLTGKPGYNWLRTVVGVFLGIGLARMVQINMLSPAHPLVLVQLGMLSGVALSVELLARLRSRAP
jgi:uncharacterized membrane protein